MIFGSHAVRGIGENAIVSSCGLLLRESPSKHNIANTTDRHGGPQYGRGAGAKLEGGRVEWEVAVEVEVEVEVKVEVEVEGAEVEVEEVEVEVRSRLTNTRSIFSDFFRFLKK